MKIREPRARLLVLGDGDLSRRVSSYLVTCATPYDITIAARNTSAAHLYANLAKFSATNLGCDPRLEVAGVDLTNRDATADLVEKVRPDVVFIAASLQSWRRITELPRAAFDDIDNAQLGPWLPMHLALVYSVMQAISETSCAPITVNAAYPDAVGPVLATQDLQPTCGIGNVANVIPALTHAASQLTGHPTAELQVRMVAHHFVSHYVPRFGEARGLPYDLDVSRQGVRVDVSHDDLFEKLTGTHRRAGGVDGQALTASSAVRILDALAREAGTAAHAPAIDGRPGGYPVIVSSSGLELDLPSNLSLQEALELNESGQRRDGIERITSDGTVYFAPEQMAVMERLIGYRCDEMPLADVFSRAEELAAKYAQFKAKFD